jgi:hypothetical protein
MAFFEVLSRHLPGDTEDEAGRCPKLDSKSAAPECESQATKREMHLTPFCSLGPVEQLPGVPIGRCMDRSSHLNETHFLAVLKVSGLRPFRAQSLFIVRENSTNTNTFCAHNAEF